MSNNFFSELADMPAAGDLLPPGWRRRRRPDHQEPHVLLVRDGRLRLEHDPQRLDPLPDQHASATATSRSRVDAAGRLIVIYDPLTGDANGNDRTPFPGNIIPPNRINPVGPQPGEHLPDCRRAT